MQEMPLGGGMPPTNKMKSISIIGVLAAALLAGGGAYAYQRSQATKDEHELQGQIDRLKSQLAVAAASTPSPTPTASPVATATPTPTTVPASKLTSSQLMNFTYKDGNGKSRTLKDGTVAFSATGGTGSLTIVQDYGFAEGDLDGDGSIDSVVILADNQGGTGTGFIIAAVLNKKGQPVLGAQEGILEDRATVTSFSIDNKVITVKGMVHGADQPLADEGNTPKTEEYKLVSGKLVAQ